MYLRKFKCPSVLISRFITTIKHSDKEKNKKIAKFKLQPVGKVRFKSFFEIHFPSEIANFPS